MKIHDNFKFFLCSKKTFYSIIKAMKTIQLPVICQFLLLIANASLFSQASSFGVISENCATYNNAKNDSRYSYSSKVGIKGFPYALLIGSPRHNDREGLVEIFMDIRETRIRGADYPTNRKIQITPPPGTIGRTGKRHFGFGSAIATGDFNNDGITEIAIGSECTNIIYVYSIYPNMEIKLYSRLIKPGKSLAVGDFNGDGIDDLVAGGDYIGKGNSHNANEYRVKGKVNIFFGRRNQALSLDWSNSITEPDYQKNNPSLYFGSTLTAGDLGYRIEGRDKFGRLDNNRDEVIIANPNASVNGQKSGAVYVYRMIPKEDSVFELVDFVTQSPAGIDEEGDLFGYSLAVADFTGYPGLFIGAPGENPSNLGKSGTVFIASKPTPYPNDDYKLRTTKSINPDMYLQGRNPEETEQELYGFNGGMRFGTSLSFTNTSGFRPSSHYGQLLVGAPGTYKNGSGAVYTYAIYQGGPPCLIKEGEAITVNNLKGSNPYIITHRSTSEIKGLVAGSNFGQQVLIQQIEGYVWHFISAPKHETSRRVIRDRVNRRLTFKPGAIFTHAEITYDYGEQRYRDNIYKPLAIEGPDPKIEEIPEASIACNDGLDNDNDGLIDLNDPGCSSATDNSEYNYIESPGLKSIFITNCETKKVQLSIWRRNITTNGIWSRIGEVDFHGNSVDTCPSSNYQPFEVSLPGDQIWYEIVIVNSNLLTCDGRDDPNYVACRKWSGAFRSDSNGSSIQQLIY